MGLPTNDWTGNITGSAYTDLEANKITAPHGKVIIAIQALGDHGVDNVLTNVVAEDSTMYANTVASAHTGTASDTTNETTATIAAGTAITMDTSYVTKGYAVGWYADGVGIPYGTKVTEVNVGGDVLEIKLDGAFANTDGQTVYFTNPTDTTHGTGGRQLDDGTDVIVVSNGSIIHGRWHSVQLGSDANAAGLICYFGE
jgi:hypothetical protein